MVVVNVQLKLLLINFLDGDEMIKDFKIDKRDEGISLSHLDDVNQCHILTSSYGEVTSISLNRTEVKRIIKWLERWLVNEK